jgi:hypothetical protein
MRSASVKLQAMTIQSDEDGARDHKTTATTMQAMQTKISGTSVTSCRNRKTIISFIIQTPASLTSVLT